MHRVAFRGRPALDERIAILLLLAAVAAPAGAGPTAEPETTRTKTTRTKTTMNVAALEQAFRFATAIGPDPTDQARSQHSVALNYAEAGLVDEAVARARRIDGWRRGAALADLASWLAREGRADEARMLLAQAREVRAGITTWHGPRIDAHMAEALALLGDLDRVRSIAEALVEGDARQYEGRVIAMLAAGMASRGEFDRAMAELAGYDDTPDLDVAWWRTSGYVSLAREPRLGEVQRLRALEAAMDSAADVPDWRRAASLQAIADLARGLGRPDLGREALAAGQEAIDGISDELPMKAPLVADQAAAWAREGFDQRARELARSAESGVELALVIERPGILARLAAAWVAIGDRSEAERLFHRALTEAEGLVNARPRALAVVAITMTMAGSGWPLDDRAHERLDALYAGLGDPW